MKERKNLNKHTKRNLNLTCINVRTAHMCVRIIVRNTVVHNAAQSSFDKHQSLDAVC